MLQLAQKRRRGGVHLDPGASPFEQVRIRVESDLNRAVPHSFLDDLGSQAEATVCRRVDAPRRIEVTQRMKPSVLGCPNRIAILVLRAGID